MSSTTFKRLLAIVAVLALAMTQAAGGLASSALNELGALPLVSEPATITYSLTIDTNIQDYETNDYKVKLEEAAGVKLQFEFFPATDQAQKFAVMVASGEPLADIVIMRGQSDSWVYQYGSQGIFIPLNDYYENSSYWIKKIITDNGLDGLLDNFIMPDGNIYTGPGYNPELGNEWDHRAWINKTWLETLGLSMPTTTDELYDVLKAFKEKDPNGNGKADEIPWMGCVNGWSNQPQQFLMNAFIYYNDGSLFLNVGENGKLLSAVNQDAFKAGLEYMNKLVVDGLLSPLSFTQAQADFKTILENEDAQLIGALNSGSMSIYQTDSIRKQDMTHLPPLIGPEGVQYSTRAYQGGQNLAYISKDAKDPELCFRLLDLMAGDPVFAVSNRYGSFGTDWTWATEEDKGKGLYEAMGIPATIHVINNHWGQPQNAEIPNQVPWIRPYHYGIGGMAWGGDPYDSQYMTAQAVPDYIGKAPEEIVLRLVYTPEESERVTELWMPLYAYISESMARFITGDLQFSQWDEYKAELDAIGLNELISIAQVAWDRTHAN
ncbi:ABC transporter substrate-binding protein [Clostridia bacterium]|nr:ABC transporter substrate-binding protein [Clostridia bacterium]